MAAADGNEPKHDLTNITEYSRKLAESGQAPPPPADTSFITEQPKIEKIDDFESLEEYSKTHPAAEVAPESNAPDAMAAADVPPVAAAEPALDAFPVTPGSDQGSEQGMVQDTAPEQLLEQSPEPGPHPSNDGLSNAITGIKRDFALGSDEMAITVAPPPEQPEHLAGLTSTGTGEEAHSAASGPAMQPAMLDDFVPAAVPVREATRPMEQVRRFSDRMTAGKPTMQASFPFSLRVTGKLTDFEKERLVDLVTRENIGLTEMDLEPQLQEGRILIPRISEYAGILIVQALRGARVTMALAPSDSVYSTDDTHEHDDDPMPGNAYTKQETDYYSDLSHPAETMSLTPLPHLPNLGKFVAIDMVTATATLKTTVVEATRSSEYQEIVDALQREIKYKAYRRGATAVISYTLTLTTLSLPTHYRLTAMGSAVKPV